MQQKILKTVTVLSIFMFLMAPLVVSAAITDPGPAPVGLPSLFTACDNVNAKVACLVTNVLQILLAIVFFVAVVFLVIGGFRYIISQGNEEGVEKAKGTLTNSIIGIVVVLLAWIIMRVIVSLLESGAGAAR